MEIKILGTGCPKCKTLEKLTREVVEQNGIDATIIKVEDIMENLYFGEVSFKAINLDDDSSKAIAEKLKVSGQSLLIVKGDQQINLTNEGFMYAMSNPAKFKSIIKEKIDVLRN